MPAFSGAAAVRAFFDRPMPNHDQQHRPHNLLSLRRAQRLAALPDGFPLPVAPGVEAGGQAGVGDAEEAEISVSVIVDHFYYPDAPARVDGHCESTRQAVVGCLQGVDGVRGEVDDPDRVVAPSPPPR